jgi:riboflavin transport system substrate-binding protein
MDYGTYSHARPVRARLAPYAVIAVLVAATLLAAACGGREDASTDAFNVGVFVPGVVEGSPTYEMLVAGVTRAVEEAESATVKVVEGGFNQGQWEQGITAMAASGEYDLIVSSNPEIPELAASVSASYPDQQFLLMDGYLADHPQIHTVMFNQREQAFLAGYFAGLVTQSEMEHANDQQVVGLLAGQEYPVMNDIMLPGYELGVRSAAPQGAVDFRVLGNWYDASAAAELADSMMINGADVILTIAGGGNQGVISAARDRGAYVVWYDVPGYDEEPGVVVGSTFVALDRAAYERTGKAIAGTLAFPGAEVLSAADGYVGFDNEDPRYLRHVPEAVRIRMASVIESMQSGELFLEMPLR